MFKWILFFFLSFNAFALEISILGAKEDHKKYSTLHLKDSIAFVCEEVRNDFDEVTEIICAFNKKPNSTIKNLQNSFFKISNEVKNKTFFIRITPFEKIKLYPLIFDLTKDKRVYEADVNIAKHWMVIGYKEDLPYIKNEKQPDIAINFPFELSLDMLPYVGGLDIKGNPVHIKRVGDVTEFLKIKKLFNDKQYDKCLDGIEEVMMEYPNSLFTAELIYYKTKVYAKLDANDNVIDMAKVYLREYSSDENVPEILALIANAYALIGMTSDADYFFDRLFDEHAASEYARWGYIYKARMLEEEGSDSAALKLYKKALHETKDIDIAATAAYKLAKHLVLAGKKLEASKYIMKIVNAKPDFFLSDIVTTMDMMYSFSEEEDYKTAASIAGALLGSMNKTHDEHERLMKDKAIWLSKTNNKLEALEALNKYIEVYEGGMFEQVVNVAKDELFFDTSDANFTVKLQEYNELIVDYAGDSIGKRAIYEKAKLLRENGKFADVLEFKHEVEALDKDEYKDIPQIITDSAIGVMKKALEDKECQKVLDISHDYNITLSNKWDDGVYECAMLGGDHLLSKNVASKNINNKNLEYRKKWLYRYIQVDFATGNYSDVIEASKELIILIQGDDKSQYFEVYRVLFDTYQRLEKKDKLIQAMEDIQKHFGKDYRDIERYVAVMGYGSEIKDDNIVIKYGKEVYETQRKNNSYAQSPFVEFALYQAYINMENLEQALSVIKSLDSVKLNKTQRSRQKYMLGVVYSKLWRDEEAQMAYQEAIDADNTSSWAKLAKSAQKI